MAKNKPEGGPIPALTEADLTEVARGIVTGQLMMAHLYDPDWQVSLSLLLAAWGEEPVPPNIGLILVPLNVHARGMWLNGRVPAVTLECRLVATESVESLMAVVRRMNEVLYPESPSEEPADQESADQESPGS
jgi:hypothetical protein